MPRASSSEREASPETSGRLLALARLILSMSSSARSLRTVAFTNQPPTTTRTVVNSGWNPSAAPAVARPRAASASRNS